MVAFFPATEGSWLVNGVKKIMKEEGERIGFNIKVVEKSGTPLQVRSQVRSKKSKDKGRRPGPGLTLKSNK